MDFKTILKDILRIAKSKWFLGGVLLVVLILAGFKACDLYDNAAVWKGRYEQQKKFNDVQLNNRKDLRNTNVELQGKLDESIKEHNDALEDKDALIESKDEVIERLGRAIATELEVEGRVIEIAGEKYIHSSVFELEKSKYSALEEKFALSEFKLEIKDKVIDNWKKKYASENKLRIETEVSLSNELKLRIIGEKRVKSLEWELRKKSFFGLIKNGLIVAVGAGLIYSLVK